MKPYLALLLAITLLTANVQAQTTESIPPAPVVDSTAPAYGASLDALRLELAGVESQHQTAINVHIASAVFGVLGVGGLGGALGMVLAGVNTSEETIIVFFLVVGGGSFSIVNFILTCIGAGLDFGSASHRRKLLRAHPELSVEVTPGPGDAGVGVTLSF